MTKLLNTIALALALAVSACTANAATGTDRPMQEEARQFSCADVGTYSNDACLASMFSEVQRTEKAFLKKPSTATAIEFDMAMSVFNGALAVVSRTPAVIDLEGRYKALLKEVSDAQGKTLPRYDGLK